MMCSHTLNATTISTLTACPGFVRIYKSSGKKRRNRKPQIMLPIGGKENPNWY